MENRELITKALDYVKSEYKSTELSVDSVANHAGFNTDYFNRIFAAHTGFHVMEYARFLRLRQASLKLRTSDESVLDIALGCGYDSHESFSRAFKSQYGKTPSEYREAMRAVEPLYGEFHSETLGARLVHEFPKLKMADMDDVIDYLLERNAIKYGYIAVCFAVNGGVILHFGDDYEKGFVWAWELDGKCQVEIISEDYDTVAEYCVLFNGELFDISLYTLDEEKTVLGELEKRGIKYTSAKCTELQTVYRGEKFDLTSSRGITVRELTISDYDIIEKYYIEKEGTLAPWRKAFLTHIQYDLKCKYEYGNDNHSVFIFGIFAGEHMIGISLGGLQSAHGFTLNNCIDTSLLKEYASDEIYRYVFCFVTNEVILAGVLPFDDIQNDYNCRKHGNFNSVDLGYEIIMKCCALK